MNPMKILPASSSAPIPPALSSPSPSSAPQEAAASATAMPWMRCGPSPVLDGFESSPGDFCCQQTHLVT